MGPIVMHPIVSNSNIEGFVSVSIEFYPVVLHLYYDDDCHSEIDIGNIREESSEIQIVVSLMMMSVTIDHWSQCQTRELTGNWVVDNIGKQTGDMRRIWSFSSWPMAPSSCNCWLWPDLGRQRTWENVVVVVSQWGAGMKGLLWWAQLMSGVEASYVSEKTRLPENGWLLFLARQAGINYKFPMKRIISMIVENDSSVTTSERAHVMVLCRLLFSSVQVKRKHITRNQNEKWVWSTKTTMKF